MCRRVGVQRWVKSNPSVCLSSHLLNCAVISSFGRTVSRAASVEYVCMYVRDTSRGRPLIICSYVPTPLGHQVIEGRPMVLYVRTYVCMYVCMYIRTCTYICTCVCMYLRTCMYIRMCVRMYVLTYLYVHTYVCTYVCTYLPVCTYVCVYVCMYLPTCMYIRMCVRMYVLTYLYVRTYVCMVHTVYSICQGHGR